MSLSLIEIKLIWKRAGETSQKHLLAYMGIIEKKLGVVVHTCSPSTWKTEVRG
jgi:hypothetical protein